MSKDMSKSDSASVQSSQATGGKDTGKGTFAARAQSAGDNNSNSQGGGGTGAGGKTGGSGAASGGGGHTSSGTKYVVRN
ncbi:MAG: hypothetical protein M1825_002101 [Sarcosagium campestre]|nr:MAG: hypothetical protein M1825_002101 [Sarcosagium campestre]